MKVKCYKKKQKKNKSLSLKGRKNYEIDSIRELKEKKEYEDLMFNIALADDEDILGSVSGKLATFVHDSFRETSLRTNAENNQENSL